MISDLDVIGKAASAGGKVAGKVAEGVSTAYVAKVRYDAEQKIARIKADAEQKIAKRQAESHEYSVSVDEASEILSVTDRPFARVTWDLSPRLKISFSFSIMSIAGLFYLKDLWEQYDDLTLYKQELGPGVKVTDQAVNNTEIFAGLLGTVPMNPRALALLTGAVPDLPLPPPVTGVPRSRKRGKWEPEGFAENLLYWMSGGPLAGEPDY